MRAVRALSALLPLLLLTGCAAVGGGSGTLVTRRIEATGFDRIQAANGFQVDVSIGPSEPVEIELDDNLTDRLDARVDGGTLRLGLRRGINIGSATLRARVTMPALRGVETSGSAAVRLGDELRGDSLEASLSGASSLEGEVALTSVTLALSGASRARLTGTAGTVEAQASGASDLALEALEAADVTIEVSGASRADACATRTISATASGGSAVRWNGGGRITKSEATGGSSIEPIAS
jgi:hypothetical protein